jgi:hypothetical protein
MITHTGCIAKKLVQGERRWNNDWFERVVWNFGREWKRSE